MSPISRFVFLGAPGVGKGSLASIIGPRLGLALVGAGELVRVEIKRGTAMGKELKECSERGQLIPDDAAIHLVRRRLEQPDASGGFILDGFPRNLAQASWLDSAGFGIDRVINIVLPEWVTVRKIAARRHCTPCGGAFNLADIHEGGFDMPAILPDFDSCSREHLCPRKLERREDDREGVVRERLAVYASSSAPLIRYYESKGVLQNFPVRRGLTDTDALIDVMLST